MSSRLVKLWVWCAVALVSGSAGAAVDYGTYTLVEGGARLLRGAVWYKLVPGVAAEDGDIVEAPERAQVQLETGTGSNVNLVGPATLYLVPGKGGPPVLGLRAGWLKVAARGAGVRVRTMPLDLVVAEGTLVVRAQGPTVELFVEGGGARLVELTATGGDGAARDAKRGEYWSKAASGAFTTVPRAPQPLRRGDAAALRRSVAHVGGAGQGQADARRRPRDHVRGGRTVARRTRSRGVRTALRRPPARPGVPQGRGREHRAVPVMGPDAASGEVRTETEAGAMMRRREARRSTR